MKLNYNPLLGRAQTHPSASIIFFTLLTIGKITFSEQNNNHSPAAFDEEISLDSAHDYDRSPVNATDDAAALAKHDIQAAKADSDYNESRQQSASSLSLSDNNDPFAVTFEDYLREWSANGASHQQEADNHNAPSHRASITRSEPAKSDLIIEEEENLVRPEESATNIDYIFPAPRYEPVHRRQQHNDRLEASDEKEKNDPKPSLAHEEVRLLFSWKQLPTNKCSKTCGKGLRVYHISCVDLKFSVRVQDELCHQSNLPRPSETSDEPCNEIDCPAEWLSVEFKRCDSTTQSIDCKPELYKRAQCSMISKTGALVYLDESKCNSTKSSLAVQEEPSREEVKKEELRATEMDEKNIDINSEELILSDDNNDIVANIDPTGALESLLSKTRRTYETQPPDEPYFHASNWSDCSGALCGQVGRRTRKISCRLYLSRSSKTTELPIHSCSGQMAPFSEEPCYMHCPPEATLENQTATSVQIFDDDTGAETIYDLEMTRFIWKAGGWTKCSTDCLGGRRESIIECWDKTTQSVVEPTSCDADLKPQVVTETCNDVPCRVEWRVGFRGVHCSKPCGSAGTRKRSLWCGQEVPTSEGTTYMQVSNDLCISVNGSVPASSEPCNRDDCKPEWSVGPWSECNRKCGEGARNRTLICVQEFANREGPKNSSSVRYAHRGLSADLLEAVAIGSKDWHPGKAVQVPFEECFREYKTAPSLEEPCYNFCDKEPYIDADLHQNYRMALEFAKKKTVTLKIGGKAQVFEGKNLKIRCKILNRQKSDNLVTKVLDQVEWRKDGIKIFTNSTTVSDKQYLPEDNSIFGRDVYSDQKDQFMADEPKQRRASTPASPHIQSRARHLNVRSWNHHTSHSDSQGNLNFLPQPGGRFALVRENTLRIKKIRPDDSGTYTCHYGSLSESLDLKVVNRRDLSYVDEVLNLTQ